MDTKLTTKEETRIVRGNAGVIFVKFISDVYKGEKLDTIVSINNQPIGTISGDTIDDFYKDFDKLITKYRI